MENFDVISREDARKIGQTWYFTGESCKNQHFDRRYTNTGVCYACKRLQNQRHYLENPESCKERNKRSNIKNKENVYKAQRKWVENNKERVRLTKRKNKLKHKLKYSEAEKERIKKKRVENPSWRLSKNMSKAIWECLKNKKNQTSWLKFVDYSLEDLIDHLESKFDSETNWDNYGTYWHIDHIRPLSWFNLETEFKDAWALSNLQPLERIKNITKGNRYEG